MRANRIHRFQSAAGRFNVAAPKPVIAPTKAASVPFGFVVCPGMTAVSAWQQAIYRQAYERAKAAAEIPRHYRRLFSMWN